MSKTNRVAPYRVLVRLLCLASIAGLVLACGADDAPAPEAEAASAAGASAPDPTGAAREASVTEGELPVDFPTDLPLYPGAVAGSSLGIPGAGMLVTFQTDDAVGAVSEYFDEELPKAGWAVTDQGEGLLTAAKGTRKASFRISAAQGGGSTIAVSIEGA